MADHKKQMQELRQRIDEIDAQILELISERVKIAKEIATVKHELGDADFYRPEREAQVLRSVIARNKGPLTNEQMARLFREIMSATLSAEGKLKVAFLGPSGTYTQSAALKHFGHAVETVPFTTIAGVFRAVERDQVHYGVVPIENSSEGVVTHTLDMFLESPLTICGEIQLRVRHQLLSAAQDVKSIKKVLAHEQALAQCRRWLAENLPDCKLTPVRSNAEAAQLARDDNTAAAVASSDAAEIYGLNVLASDIEDDPGNTTRFLVIGKRASGPSGDDKTSLLISSANRPGALHSLLTPLAESGVSMSRIESRPSRKGLWEYVFFIDIEGHAEDKHIKEVLKKLEEQAAVVKMLGAYPRAVL